LGRERGGLGVIKEPVGVQKMVGKFHSMSSLLCSKKIESIGNKLISRRILECRCGKREEKRRNEKAKREKVRGALSGLKLGGKEFSMGGGGFESGGETQLMKLGEEPDQENKKT